MDNQHVETHLIPPRVPVKNISSFKDHVDFIHVRPYLSKERLEVLSEVEKQMKKLFEMKESLINGGTSKFAPGKSPFVIAILSKTPPTRVKLPSLEAYDRASDLYASHSIPCSNAFAWFL